MQERAEFPCSKDPKQKVIHRFTNQNNFLLGNLTTSRCLFFSVYSTLQQTFWNGTSRMNISETSTNKMFIQNKNGSISQSMIAPPFIGFHFHLLRLLRPLQWCGSFTFGSIVQSHHVRHVRLTVGKTPNPWKMTWLLTLLNRFQCTSTDVNFRNIQVHFEYWRWFLFNLSSIFGCNRQRLQLT